LNGRNAHLIEPMLVEISKDIMRPAVVRAGGNVAAQIATWDGKNFNWLPRPEEKKPVG